MEVSATLRTVSMVASQVPINGSRRGFVLTSTGVSPDPQPAMATASVMDIATRLTLRLLPKLPRCPEITVKALWFSANLRPWPDPCGKLNGSKWRVKDFFVFRAAPDLTYIPRPRPNPQRSLNVPRHRDRESEGRRR